MAHRKALRNNEEMGNRFPSRDGILTERWVDRLIDARGKDERLRAI
jgi:hypothetical protein